MNIEQLQLFEEQTIRTAWDEENEEWYFSIVDVVGILTEDCTFSAVITLFFLPSVFERKRGMKRCTTRNARNAVQR